MRSRNTCDARQILAKTAIAKKFTGKSDVRCITAISSGSKSSAKGTKNSHVLDYFQTFKLAQTSVARCGLQRSIVEEAGRLDEETKFLNLNR
jgi:hypothetical protein